MTTITMHSDRLDRNTVTKTIKRNLQKRSGKQWSVSGGMGSVYGWITIIAPKTNWMTHDECRELQELLDLKNVHPQGVDIMASTTAYEEYISRSLGETPVRIAEPYWD